jgi:hypothetical protein
MTVAWVLVAEPPWGAGGGGRGEPFICAAIWAQVVVAFCILLKLAALSGVVFSFTEFLIMVTFFCIFCVHLTAFWTCWRTFFSAGYCRILPISAIVDSR